MVEIKMSRRFTSKPLQVKHDLIVDEEATRRVLEETAVELEIIEQERITAGRKPIRQETVH